MKTTSLNYKKVIFNIEKAIHLAAADPEERAVWFEALDEMLDKLLGADFFGTEGQCDPRGDHRDR